MKSPFNNYSVLTIVLFFISFTINGQDSSSSKLLGTWGFVKYEFITQFPDSLNMIQRSQGITMTFENENKFVTKDKTNNIIDSGTYRIEGKNIIQNNEIAEIISLTEMELILKIPEVMIVHLKRGKTTK